MNKILPTKYVFFLVFLIGLSGFGQQALLKVADKQFRKQQYIEAQQMYLKVLEKEYRSAKIFQNLGDTYYYNGQFENASKWYKELIESYPNQFDPEYLFRYAQSLKSYGDYKSADNYMDEFSKVNSEDIRANLFTKQKNYLKRIEYQSNRYEIEKASINSKFSDFGTSFYGDHIVFSSSRDTLLIRQRKHKWTEESFLDLYISKYNPNNGELSEVFRFSDQLNSKFHESTPVFTKDGKTVYFTRNNLNKNLIRKNAKKVNRLKIYKATKAENGTWNSPEELPFNSDDYSIAHPALSYDEKTLYFSSDMPGGFGQSDLYKVAIENNGVYGQIENLGNKINTEGKETFPFITNQNELYFASDGHQGLGGLDIFITRLMANGSHRDIINIGKPINSTKDDFAFIINNDMKIGYFSTNRDDAYKDDIYSFLELLKIKSFYAEIIIGTVKDKNNQKPLNGAKVSLYNKKNILIEEMIVDKDGKYSFSLKQPEKNYTIEIANKGYRSAKDTIDIKEFSETYESQSELEKINKFMLYADPDKVIVQGKSIKPGYLEKIEKIIKLLQKHNSIDLEILTYFDKKNDLKSKKTANVIIQYFVNKGIPKSRLKYKVNYLNKSQFSDPFRLMMEVPPILFQTNSGKILPNANPGLLRVLEIMQLYPNINVEIQGYADSRGRKDTNIKVSNKRAQSIRNYLIDQGIDSKRLIAKGYGESKLRNHCSDGVNCSDEEHKYNRRCEFMVIQ